MAYSVSNPPKLMFPSMGTNQPALWAYTSTDVHTTVVGADYFTDGAARGLRVGDIMFVSKSSATIGTTVHYVQTVTAGGAATLASAILA